MIWSREADNDLIRLNKLGHKKIFIAYWLCVHYGMRVTSDAVKGRLRRIHGSVAAPKLASMDIDAAIRRKVDIAALAPPPKKPRALAAWPKGGDDLPFLDVAIDDLTEKSCRWPDDNMRFCGQDKYACSPYCERHFRLAYRPVGRAGSGGVAA